MKTKILSLVLAATALACQKPKNASELFPPPDTQSKLPAYNATKIEGTLFGQSWQAANAIAQFDSKSGEVSVSVYADLNPNACSTTILSSKPYLTVVLPSLSEKAEFITIADNNRYQAPVVMIDSTQSIPMNLLAEKSKVMSSQISAEGFQLSLYATARDESGAVNSVNGQIFVKDCRQEAAFGAWKSLEGSYKLIRFNDRNVSDYLLWDSFSVNRQSFSDAITSERLEVLDLPLYYSVSSGSTAGLSLGPIKGKGVSEIQDLGLQRILKYAYKGPLKIRGYKADVDYSIEVIEMKDSGQLTLTYTAEIKDDFKKSTHKLVFQR